MKKSSIKCLNEISLAEGEVLPNEIQLLRVGEFNHFWYGRFTVNEKVLKDLVKNYKENIRGVDLAIDLDHSAGEAAGWIKSLRTKNKGTELWAEISWTALGEEKVGKKLYRYLSAEYDTSYEDAEDGVNYGYVLLGAGLTNRPFVKKMEPTSQLSETQMEEKVMEEKLKELELSNKTLSEKLDQLSKDNKKLSEALAVKDQEAKELKEKNILSERKVKFEEMLSNGKVCEAQRDSWMEQDMVKFAELSNSVKLNTKEEGSDLPEETSKEKKVDLDKKLDELIEKKLSEKSLSYGQALDQVLEENKDLEIWFNKR